MRDFAKLQVTEKLGPVANIAPDEVTKIINNSLMEIYEMVVAQDYTIIKTLPDDDVDKYVNTEVYFTLNDYLYWIDAEEGNLHTGHNCPVCEKKHRVLFLLDALIRRWELRGEKPEYEKIVRFRANAMDQGRVIN